MGLRDWLIRKQLTSYLAEALPTLTKAVLWLNAAPGRKRGVAAALLGAAAALRVLGHAEAAEGATTLNTWVQTYLTPGTDIVGSIIALAGLLHAAVRADQAKAAPPPVDISGWRDR